LKKIISAVFVTILLTFTVFAQTKIATPGNSGFIGTGVSTSTTKPNTVTGPYAEVGYNVPDKLEFVHLRTQANFFSQPGLRLEVSAHPKYFDKHELRPFFAVGSSWVKKDTFHPVVTIGAEYGDYLTVRASRLFEGKEGWRLGAEVLYPIFDSGFDVKVAVDDNRFPHAKDVVVVRGGVVKRF
jgi:hypothetical protein